jgi:hypothetical protein
VKLKWRAKGLPSADTRAKEAKKRSAGRGAALPPQVIPAFIDGHDRVMGAMKKRLERMRIQLLDRPKDSKGEDLNPVLPSDLTALNDERLGRLYGHFCQMVQYVQLQLAIQGVKRALAERAEKYIRARTWLTKQGTVGDKEAQVEVDTAVQERSLEALVEGASETMKDQIMQSYLIGKDACSREVTRRLGTNKRDLG